MHFWKRFCQINLFRQAFFFAKVENVRTMGATIAFFFPPPFFLFALSICLFFPFPSIVWLSSLSDAKNLPFGPLSLKCMNADFPRLVFKKSARYLWVLICVTNWRFFWGWLNRVSRCVVGGASWEVRRGSWVVGRGSWVVSRARVLRLTYFNT